MSCLRLEDRASFPLSIPLWLVAAGYWKQLKWPVAREERAAGKQESLSLSPHRCVLLYGHSEAIVLGSWMTDLCKHQGVFLL